MLASIILSSAQILALDTTPVQIIAAPGAGQILLPFQRALSYHFGTTQYFNGSNIVLCYGPKANNLFVHLDDYFLITNPFDYASAPAEVTMIGVEDIAANMINQPLSITLDGAGYISGDGTLTVTLVYVIAPTT